jgi:hypothetical protein
LRPCTAPFQFPLQTLGSWRARANPGEISADQLRDRRAHRVGLRRVARSLFFNDPFEQAHGKGHAACLDGLKIAWREQRLADVLDGTERLALDVTRKL